MKKNKKSSLDGFSLIELSIVFIIIGLVVTGVIGGKSLMKSARIASARRMNDGFISSWGNAVPRPAMWLEVSNEDNVKLDENDRIIRLTDGTGNGFHAIQENEDIRPTYLRDGINQLPVMDFDGIGQYLEYFASGSSSEVTIIVILQPDFSTNFSNTAVIASNLGAPGAVVVLSDKSYERIKTIINKEANASSSSDSIYAQSFSLTDKNLNLLTTIFHPLDSRENEWEIFMNGMLSYVTPNAEGIAQINMGPGVIGSVLSFGNYAVPFKGQIAEVIIFDEALTTEGRKSVEGYLGKKWGIKLN